MHLLMDSVSAQEEVNFDRWPIAGFFVGIGFFTFFFLQKVLAPSLGLGHTHNTHVITVRRSAGQTFCCVARCRIESRLIRIC